MMRSTRLSRGRKPSSSVFISTTFAHRSTHSRLRARREARSVRRTRGKGGVDHPLGSARKFQWAEVRCAFARGEVEIRDLANLMAEISGFTGKLVFRPDARVGTLRKTLDSSILDSLGWSPKISLQDGLSSCISDFFEAMDTNSLGSF